MLAQNFPSFKVSFVMKSDFAINHIEGKIAQIWLANEEGIFS
jgi:hypothetical protein